jgi:hypothetical protein
MSRREYRNWQLLQGWLAAKSKDPNEFISREHRRGAAAFARWQSVDPATRYPRSSQSVVRKDEHETDI